MLRRPPEVGLGGATDRADPVGLVVARIEHVRAAPAPPQLTVSHRGQDTNRCAKLISLRPEAGGAADVAPACRSDHSVLVLFDIDGTLLQGTTEPVGQAMRAALQEVHGIDMRVIRTRIPTAGRTDGEIARAILIEAGVCAERIDALADCVCANCCRWSARLLPEDLSNAVAPGVRELLNWLAEHQDVKLGLLTGNYEPIARLKLTRAGIGGVFALGPGAFGSDAEDRAALPPIARRRAGSVKAPYPRCQTIVIGDTPRDILCARADGLRCVAVASGDFTSDALAAADAVARDALELRPILSALGVGLLGGAPLRGAVQTRTAGLAVR